MNRVSISAEEVPLPLSKNNIESYILKILDYLEKDNWDVSVLFCGNRRITELNMQYRKENEATDVLSFTLGEQRKGRYMAGDIVISLETMKENAAYFGVSPEEELRRLLIHGILHLNNMDHETNESHEPMLELQETILAELTGEHIL